MLTYMMILYPYAFPTSFYAYINIYIYVYRLIMMVISRDKEMVSAQIDYSHIKITEILLTN